MGICVCRTLILYLFGFRYNRPSYEGSVVDTHRTQLPLPLRVRTLVRGSYGLEGRQLQRTSEGLDSVET